MSLILNSATAQCEVKFTGTANKVVDVDSFIGNADINTALALKANTADLKEIGVGQTWQDVTASRASGVTYTNTTGKPIMVCWSGGLTNTQGVYIGGVLTCVQTQTTASAGWFFSFIVPNNSTYSIIYTTLAKWFELR